MNKFRILIFSIFLVTGINNLIAQNFSEDLAAINLAYFSLEKHVELKTVVTKNGVITTNQTVHSYMRGLDDYYMKNESTEVLIRSGIRVAVNKDFKVVMVDSNAEESKSSLPISLFDTISKAYSSTKYSNISDSKGLYTLVPIFGTTKSVKIYFWKESKLIDKIEVELTNPKNNEKYIITNTYQYSNLTQTDIPALSKYLRKSSTGEYQLQTTWRGYEYINNIAKL